MYQAIGNFQSPAASLVCADRDEVHVCVHELVEQQIAYELPGTRFEIKKMSLETNFSRGPRRDAGVIRLQSAKGNYLTQPAPLCIRQQIFQFARLVSTQSGTEIVIAFDEDLTSQFGAQARQMLERRRIFGERDAGKGLQLLQN
jgi:hypothetical protein